MWPFVDAPNSSLHLSAVTLAKWKLWSSTFPWRFSLPESLWHQSSVSTCKRWSSLMCLHHFLHCVTALIMWVKVSHSKWVGPDQKQGETRLPEVLHHKWPSNPAGSLRHRCHRAYITALRKRDRHSKNRMMMKHFIDPCREGFLFCLKEIGVHTRAGCIWPPYCCKHKRFLLSTSETASNFKSHFNKSPVDICW